jgi:hypothetical protein
MLDNPIGQGDDGIAFPWDLGQVIVCRLFKLGQRQSQRMTAALRPTSFQFEA